MDLLSENLIYNGTEFCVEFHTFEIVRKFCQVFYVGIKIIVDQNPYFELNGNVHMVKYL